MAWSRQYTDKESQKTDLVNSCNEQSSALKKMIKLEKGHTCS